MSYETSKPINVPGFVGKVVVEEMQKMPHTSEHWVKYKAVVRPQSGKTENYDFRIFDEWEADQKGIKITNFASLDAHPDLIRFEGWFDSKAKKAQVKAKQAA